MLSPAMATIHGGDQRAAAVAYGHGWYKPARAGFLLDEAPDALERLLVLQPAVPQLPAELILAIRAHMRARVQLGEQVSAWLAGAARPHRAGPAGTGQPERLDAGHLGASRTCRAVRFMGLPAAGRGRSGTAQRSPTRWNSAGTARAPAKGCCQGYRYPRRSRSAAHSARRAGGPGGVRPAGPRGCLSAAAQPGALGAARGRRAGDGRALCSRDRASGRRLV